MKLKLPICLLALVFLINSCKEQEPKTVIKSIPAEDRFIFNAGEQLLYHCNDGTMDTVRVNDVDFYTHSYTENDLFGNPWNYRIDHGRISLVIADTSWLRILHYACHQPEDCNECVNMETDSFLEEVPTTHVYFGCESYGGLVFATGVLAMDEVLINGKLYQKVYSWNHVNSENNGFRMHWSLKYGIIRFEGEIGETLFSWDLVIP